MELLNLTSALHGLPAVIGRDACADDLVRLGWPLQFYQAGGCADRLLFSISMLALDVGLALWVAAALGWPFSPRRD